MAGARGNGSGVASAGILGAGWAALTNGFPIVYCPPVCEEARPLTDLGHVGSIVFGVLLALIRHLVAVARPGAPGLVHAGRCGSLGGRHSLVAGEHCDGVGAPDSGMVGRSARQRRMSDVCYRSPSMLGALYELRTNQACLFAGAQ